MFFLTIILLSLSTPAFGQDYCASMADAAALKDFIDTASVRNDQLHAELARANARNGSVSSYSSDINQLESKSTSLEGKLREINRQVNASEIEEASLERELESLKLILKNVVEDN